MTLRNRLEKLETVDRSGCIFIWRRHDETDDQAKARWKEEHPGEDPDRAGLSVILVQWADAGEVVS